MASIINVTTLQNILVYPQRNEQATHILALNILLRPIKKLPGAYIP